MTDWRDNYLDTPSDTSSLGDIDESPDDIHREIPPSQEKHPNPTLPPIPPPLTPQEQELLKHVDDLLDQNNYELDILHNLLNCDGILGGLSSLKDQGLNLRLFLEGLRALPSIANNHMLTKTIRGLQIEQEGFVNTLAADYNQLYEIDHKLFLIGNAQTCNKTNCPNCGNNESLQLSLSCRHRICSQCICARTVQFIQNDFPISQLQLKCPISNCFYILTTQEMQEAKQNIQNGHLLQLLNTNNEIFQSKKCPICCRENIELLKMHEREGWEHNICEICLRNYLLYENNGNPLLINPNTYNPKANFSDYLEQNRCPFRDCTQHIDPQLYIQLYGFSIDKILDDIIARLGGKKKIGKISNEIGDFEENIIFDMVAQNKENLAKTEQKEEFKGQKVEAVCFFEGCKENDKLTNRFKGCKGNCPCFVCKIHIFQFGKGLLKQNNKCPKCQEKLDGSLANRCLSKPTPPNPLYAPGKQTYNQ